jgi:hypothetical protein
MLLFAAAIIAASSPPEAPRPRTGITVQATAMVRIITGVEVRLDGRNNGSDIPAPRSTFFTSGGIAQPARLIEFQ